MRSPANLSFAHLMQPPRQASERPALLVLLHGYGSNEEDLFGLAPYVDPRFLIVSPRAPYMIMPGGYAWFELNWTATGITINAQQADLIRRHIVHFITEALDAYECAANQVYLAGFSQGAMLSASVALSEPELVAGTVLMSGRVSTEIMPQIASAERLTGKPFLITHGTSDTVLPIQDGRASRTLLETLPVELTYKEYRMAHEINAESLADITAWLTKQLDRTQGKE